VKVTLAHCLPLYRGVFRLSTPLPLAHLPDTKPISAFCITHIPDRRLVKCLLWQLHHVSPFCCLHGLTGSGRDVGAVYLHAFRTRLWGIMATDTIWGSQHLKSYLSTTLLDTGFVTATPLFGWLQYTSILRVGAIHATIFCVLPVHKEHVLSRPNTIILNSVWLSWSRQAWMECGPCTYFAYYTMAFTFKLVENSMENTLEKVVEKCQLARFIMLIWPSVGTKYWTLCWPRSPYRCLADLGQPSVA